MMNEITAYHQCPKKETVIHSDVVSGIYSIDYGVRKMPKYGTFFFFKIDSVILLQSKASKSLSMIEEYLGQFPALSSKSEFSLLKIKKKYITKSSMYSERQKSLSSQNSYNTLIETMKDMKRRLESIATTQTHLSQQIASISERLVGKDTSCEERNSIIYFKERNKFHEALSYLSEHQMGGQLLGSGTMIASQKVVDKLSEAGFQFGVVKSTKELYEKEPDIIKNYANQVRKHYKSPRGQTN